MKKLKIFLLLSILLCFGFVLSHEVHAQSNGPKVFEVGDILPATTQLKISTNEFIPYEPGPSNFYIKTNDSNFILVDAFIGNFVEGDNRIYFYVDEQYVDTSTWGSELSVIIDTSSWSLEKRTVSYVDSLLVDGDIAIFTWEDLNAPKPFEVGDTLPAGYIKISWDFTGKFNDIFDEDVTFWIVGDGDPENNLYIEIEVWDYGEEVRFTINDEEFYIDTPGEIVISIPISYTITQIDASEGYDYYESIGDALMWKVATEEDFIYSEAYQDGYSDGYFLGYEHAREIYGYYDSKTNEWLTVSEYIFRYGTDKPGSSDFYANFDKYFIPAMIIVFGGAIVLTILKVFKGRE